MKWRLKLSVLVAVCALGGPLVSDANAQSNDPAAAEDRAAKLAAAESIITREEAASGRVFDPGYRAEVLNKLASRSLDELASFQARSSGLGIQAYADSGVELVFVPVTPCRLFDTRISQGGAGPITPGPAGQRSFFTAGLCGVPFGPATGEAINFVAVNPSGPGNLRVTAFGSPMPGASVINYTAVPGLNIANGIDIKICDPEVSGCPLDITIQADVSATDVLADVFGYYKKLPPAGRATAVVVPGSPPTFDSSRTRNFTAVSQAATGDYCLTPTSRIFDPIDPSTTPVYVTVEWSFSSGNSLAAFHRKTGFGCPAGDIEVLTFSFTGAATNSVSFEVFVP